MPLVDGDRRAMSFGRSTLDARLSGVCSPRMLKALIRSRKASSRSVPQALQYRDGIEANGHLKSNHQ
jgi:hypothetical protein